MSKTTKPAEAAFDPWVASLADAEAAAGERDSLDPRSPNMQWAVASAINEARSAVESGDGLAIMGCVQQCLHHGLVAPSWLADAFSKRYWPVATLSVESWDDSKAFGLPVPKRRHISRIRQDRVGRFAVWSAVSDALSRNPDRAIDRGLFEEIGKPLKFGATRTERLYYEAVKMGLGNIAKSKKFAGIRKRRR